MKNIIKIDITTYLLIILAILSASFEYLIILFSIVIFHELGHLFWLKKYHKKIISIKIYPFGGITKYESYLNHHLKEELLISLGGIINQIFLIFIITLIYKINLINLNTFNLFIKSNYLLLIFNLLPIIPLDGSKILNIIFEYFLSYYKSLLIMIIISIICLITFTIIIITNKINNLIILSFLYYNIYLFIRNYPYLKERFIIERLLYDLPYKKIKYDTLFRKDKLKQETYHYYDYISEKKILAKIYKR